MSIISEATPDYRHPETREEFIKWLSDSAPSFMNHGKSLDELKAMSDDELKGLYWDIHRMVHIT